MKPLITLLLLVGTEVLAAAPPVIGPEGPTSEQINAQHQGKLSINAALGISQNVAGSKVDEYSAMNPGANQARFLLNTVASNAIIQAPQLGDRNSGYLKMVNRDSVLNHGNRKAIETRAPFASNITKSQLQGMVFLKGNLSPAYFENYFNPTSNSTSKIPK
ncbi:hypothetical protein [Polynucleobacter sp. AP-Latsch-80-C2]|jgi:hypothetical protein|uniref:hypothetical protein n=1 Tax=Polynucleobacter sp. AP-Latsch-80-C2 TaxID=2576931 RepID=UPI001C0D68DD|nr:hypothetical protein [Polynucleobacter sp. AP-Latsch-80-C2]MBU3622133.1 hypothetical protein [Polynucleobacter sp. AP-Latsch-80-C2]